MITVYSQAGCYPCKATIRELTKLQLPHTVIDVTLDPAATAYVTGLGYTGTPVVDTGTTHWSGHSPTKIHKLAAEHFDR